MILQWDYSLFSFEFTPQNNQMGSPFTTGISYLTNGSGKYYGTDVKTSNISAMKRGTYDYVLTYNGEAVEGEFATGSINLSEESSAKVLNSIFSGFKSLWHTPWACK